VTDDKPPVDAADDLVAKMLDLLVYAPLGAATQLKEQWPHLAQQGREAAASGLPMYRTVGEFAVKNVMQKVEQHAGGITDLLASLGLVPKSQPAQTASEDEGPDDEAPEAPADTSPVAPSGPELSAPTADELPVGGYDTMPAVEVVKMLQSLDATERATVRTYEETNRGRRTILGKLDQLAQRDNA
jgi:hypothetical protein